MQSYEVLRETITLIEKWAVGILGNIESWIERISSTVVSFASHSQCILTLFFVMIKTTKFFAYFDRLTDGNDKTRQNVGILYDHLNFCAYRVRSSISNSPPGCGAFLSIACTDMLLWTRTLDTKNLVESQKKRPAITNYTTTVNKKPKNVWSFKYISGL